MTRRSFRLLAYSIVLTCLSLACSANRSSESSSGSAASSPAPRTPVGRVRVTGLLVYGAGYAAGRPAAGREVFLVPVSSGGWIARLYKGTGKPSLPAYPRGQTDGSGRFTIEVDRSFVENLKEWKTPSTKESPQAGTPFFKGELAIAVEKGRTVVEETGNPTRFAIELEEVGKGDPVRFTIDWKSEEIALGKLII